MLREHLAEDAPAVEDFCAQQAPPPIHDEGPILVAQADGKGVPILRLTQGRVPLRLGKGQKHVGTKEAVLTGIYTIAPNVRTPEDVVESLFAPEMAGGTRPRERHGPQHKRLWATLRSKDAALAEASTRGATREGAHSTDHVALTDGSQALLERVQRRFPAYTRVLDLIHATEYLWKAANALLGETHPQRTAWVKARTLLLLQSQSTLVGAEFRRLAQERGRTRRQRTVLTAVAADLERNTPVMRYADYVAARLAPRHRRE